MLASCGTIKEKDGPSPDFSKKWYEIPDATVGSVTRSRFGNPDSYVVFGKTYYVMDSAVGFQQKGIASWYGTKFHGRRTSSGEEYDMYAMTAAHTSLPIPVYVEVTNLDNNRKAIVRVNDRGPFHPGRIIDLSYAGATKLGFVQAGTANVSIRVLKSESDKNRLRSNAVVESPLTAAGRLYVQVAAFSSEDNALSHIAKLQREGFNDVKLHIESKKGKVLHRVRIGPFSSEYLAKNVVAKLEKNNHKSLKIVKK